ncbi:mitochondrial peptide methionine sulfoxide reductase isoform X1 [Pelobates cultripes]|uniref:Mitochondrial peptide methionine sulfoxide reductase n=1 Tax=Pelobates cultripes TaxID=61616 RepID=A0AAD1R2I7_PELCU|nr:mitochondrial peptide methionine sulfoxide reductase isoform X1 [Pelobates cultripes]
MPSKTVLPTAQEALPGRAETLQVAAKHTVNGNTTLEPFPAGLELAMFGMGCFWGVEKLFWNQKGVFSTQVGYAGGYTPNPTYEEVCTGLTAHVEVVRIVFDPKVISYSTLLKIFWENHNPTEGMKQGVDIGTQYRSVIYTYGDQQMKAALISKETFQKQLARCNWGAVTTEIHPTPVFYYAEDYHQQYLHKNPEGYCGIKGTGVTCPMGN